MAQFSTIRAEQDPLALMRAIAEQRDRRAFAVVFNLYAPRLKAFLMQGGLEAAVAEELVQEVMLTVWQRAETYDPALGGLATWIFTIARNRRIDHFRRLQRMAEDPGEPEVEPVLEEELGTAALVERQSDHIFLLQAIDSLPPEQADVLRAAFLEQKAHSAIAREKRLPLGTVKSRIRLALRQLRRLLEPEP